MSEMRNSGSRPPWIAGGREIRERCGDAVRGGLSCRSRDGALVALGYDRRVADLHGAPDAPGLSYHVPRCHHSATRKSAAAAR